MIINIITTLLIIHIWVYPVLAQQPNKKEVNLDDYIQEVFQEMDEDVNYEELYETLFHFIYNPINLNNTNLKELQSLHILSPLQINNLLEHSENTGQFISLYELQSVSALDHTTIQRLLPFVTIAPYKKNNSLKGILSTVINNEQAHIITRYGRTLENKAGYTNSRYLGNPDNFYLRYRSNVTKDYSFGFTCEKDGGEKLFYSHPKNPYLIDFLSFHLGVFEKKYIKALVIGDYQMQFGQGLIMGAGFSLGKGAETIASIKKSNVGIRPYTSVSEAGFFRGIASSLHINKNCNLTTFYSSKKIDGNLEMDFSDQDSTMYASSIKASGYHRTVSDLEDKNTISEKIFGLNTSFLSNDQKFHIGATAVNTQYSIPVIKEPKPYNLFDFRGTHNYTYGIDFDLLIQNFVLFGEFASSKSKGYGILTGFVSSLSPKVDLSILYRNYSTDFHSFYGNAFSENTRNINEEGVYLGIKIKPVRSIAFSAYYDRYKFPWLKYLVDAPSAGDELMFRMDYTPGKTSHIYSQLRIRNKEKNLPEGEGNFNIIAETGKMNFMVHLNYTTADHLTLQSRIQLSTYQKNNTTTTGYYMMVEISKKIQKFRLASRIGIFDCDDYDNRQYAYEKDVLYAFSIPAFYNKGTRVYLLAFYPITKKIDLWVKYARTKYLNLDVISSGNEQIEGSKKTEIRVQIRYKFN